MKQGLSCTPYVKCLLSVDICDNNGQTSNYLLASDNHRHLFFIQQGSIVLVLNTPDVITAVSVQQICAQVTLEFSSLHWCRNLPRTLQMASGYFMEQQLLESVAADQPASATQTTQIVLGSETGAIYLVSNFEVRSCVDAPGTQATCSLHKCPGIRFVVDTSEP